MATILFVGSDDVARERWREALQRRGRHVEAVAPGCGSTASPEDLDAVIVDVQAAVDWGHLRDFAKTRPPTAPLIVMTSWSAPDGRYRQMAFRAGCDAFVMKPCSAETLISVIERLAAGERAIEVGGRR